MIRRRNQWDPRELLTALCGLDSALEAVFALGLPQWRLRLLALGAKREARKIAKSGLRTVKGRESTWHAWLDREMHRTVGPVRWRAARRVADAKDRKQLVRRFRSKV